MLVSLYVDILSDVYTIEYFLGGVGCHHAPCEVSQNAGEGNVGCNAIGLHFMEGIIQ